MKHEIRNFFGFTSCACKSDVEIDTGNLGNMIYHSSLGDVVSFSDNNDDLHRVLSSYQNLPYTRDTTAQGSITGNIHETFTEDNANDDGRIYQFNKGEVFEAENYDFTIIENTYGTDLNYALKLYEYPEFPHIFRLGESATYTVESSNGFNTDDLSLDVQMFGHKWKIEVFVVGGETLEFGPEYFETKRHSSSTGYVHSTENREYFTTYVTSSDGTRTPYSLNPFKDGDCANGGSCIINEHQDMAYTSNKKESDSDTRTSGYATIAITFEKESGKFKCFVEGQLISEMELPSGGGGTINKIKFTAGDGQPVNAPHYLYMNSLRMWDQANDYTLQKHYYDVQDYDQCVCKANAKKITVSGELDHTLNQCEICPNNQVAVRSGVGKEYSECGCPMGFELYNDKCICIQGVLTDGKCQACPEPSIPNQDHSVCVCEGSQVVLNGQCQECPSHKFYQSSDPEYGRVRPTIYADETQTRCECKWEGFEFNGVDECDCHNGIITEVVDSGRVWWAPRRYKCTPCPQYSTSTNYIKPRGVCVCNEGLTLDPETNTCVCENSEATFVDGVCVVCKVEEGFTLEGIVCRDCSGTAGGTLVRNEWGVCTKASSSAFFAKMRNKGKINAGNGNSNSGNIDISIRGKSAEDAKASMFTFEKMFDDIFDAPNVVDRKQARVERRRFVDAQRKDFNFGKTVSNFGRRRSKENFLQMPKRMLRADAAEDDVVYVANKKPDTAECESVFEIFEEGMSYIAPEFNTACSANGQKIFIECEGEKQEIATLIDEESDGGYLYNGLNNTDYDNDISVDVTCFNREISIQLAGSFTAENGNCIRGAGWDGTQCVECVAGTTFSNEVSLQPCQECTTCTGDTLFECTTEADAVCCKDYLVSGGTECICPQTGFRDTGTECVCQGLDSERMEYAFNDECKSISLEELAIINAVLHELSSDECPLA